MSERRLDPFAVAVLGAAALCGIGLAGWLAFEISRQPPPAAPAEVAPKGKTLPPVPKATAKPPAPPAVATVPVPAAKPPADVAPRRGISLEAGRTWSYAVRVEPEVWREAVLVYRTQAEGSILAVHAEFRHAGGQVAFRLGPYVPGHPSHAQARFPGFFLHGAHLEFPLQAGKRFSWTTPWQAQDHRVRDGRVRRWSATVGDTEKVSVPAGRFDAIRIDTVLTYEDGGQVQATVYETLWYAPAARQIVKVLRSGRSPDEPAQRIVADLAEIR